MKLTMLELKSWQSYKHSTIALDGPVSVFYGLNASGKSSLARAIGFLLRGSAAAVEGTRSMPARRLIRTGEDSTELIGQIIRREGDAPVEVNRRLTTRALTTRVQGKEVPNEAFDFFAPPGIADPDSVFRILADTEGLFLMDGEAQKALLLTLVEQAVPAEIADALPLHRIQATVRTITDLDGAYDAAYRARAEANGKRKALRAVADPGSTTKPDLGAIRTKLTGLQREYHELLAQGGEQMGERRALEDERGRLVTQRDQAAVRIRELGQRSEAEARLKALDASITQAAQAQMARANAVAQIAPLRAELERLKQQREGLAALGAGKKVALACPTCARTFTVEERTALADTLAQRSKELEKGIAEREQALPAVPDTKKLDEQRGAVQRIVQGLDSYEEQQRTAVARLAEVDARLATLPAAAGPSPEAETLRGRIAKGDENLRTAEALSRAIDEYAAYTTRAAALDAEVAELEVLVKHLGPKGIKERLLGQRIGALQAKVNRVLGVFELSADYVAEPWELRIKGVPSRLMARSEAFLCGIAHQIALAAVTGVRLCVIDGMDLLDLENRTALMQILELAVSQKVLDQAIVFATFATQPEPSRAAWLAHYLVEGSGDGSLVRRLG